jgi:hypothetical protein
VGSRKQQLRYGNSLKRLKLNASSFIEKEPSMQVVWTKEMKETLMKIASENPMMSYRDIAKRMSSVFGVTFTKNSLIGKARRLGVPQRPPAIKPAVKKDAPVTLYNLQSGCCKWPLGKFEDKPPYLYCGKDTGDISISWCPVHCRKAFGKSIYGSATTSLP